MAQDGGQVIFIQVIFIPPSFLVLVWRGESLIKYRYTEPPDIHENDFTARE
jgi:hypothetical protein